MKFVEFKEEIQKAYAKRFPNSLCEVSIFKCLGRSLYIDCYLAGDKSEFLYGYAANDMFSVGMSINLPDDFGDDDDLPEKLILEWYSSDILAYDVVRIPYRKTTGDAKKIIKALDKYFQRLYEATVKLFEEGKIHDNYADLAARKIVW